MADPHHDEPDGLDECWIPYDAYKKACARDRGERHLSDDEVNYYLGRLRDKVGERGKILVVIDACHSGDATCGDEGEEVLRGVSEVFDATCHLPSPSPVLCRDARSAGSPSAHVPAPSPMQSCVIQWLAG